MAGADVPFSMGNIDDTFSRCFYHQLLKDREKFGPKGLIHSVEEVYVLAGVKTETSEPAPSTSSSAVDKPSTSAVAPTVAKETNVANKTNADVADVEINKPTGSVQPGFVNRRFQNVIIVPEFGPDGKKLTSKQRKNLRKKLEKEQQQAKKQLVTDRIKELKELGVAEPDEVLREQREKRILLPQFYKFPKFSLMNEAEQKKYLGTLINFQMKGTFRFLENKTWFNELNRQLVEERAEYNKFVMDYANRNHQAIYKLPPPSVTFVVRLLHQKFDAIRWQFPQNFTSLTRLSLRETEQPTDMSNEQPVSDVVRLITKQQQAGREEEEEKPVVLSFTQALLEVGRSPKIFVPNMFHKVKLLEPTPKPVSKAAVAEDPTFIRLAEQWGPTVLIPFSSLKALLIAFGVENHKDQLDIPFRLKSISVSDGGVLNHNANVIVFEKPLDTTNWHNQKKNHLFMKHSVKATLVPPTVDARKLRHKGPPGSHSSPSKPLLSPKTPERNKDNEWDDYSYVDFDQELSTTGTSLNTTRATEAEGDVSSDEGDLVMATASDEEIPKVRRSRIGSDANSSSSESPDRKMLKVDIQDSPSQRTRSKKPTASEDVTDSHKSNAVLGAGLETEIEEGEEDVPAAAETHLYQPPTVSRFSGLTKGDDKPIGKSATLDFISQLKQKQSQSAFGMGAIAEERRSKSGKQPTQPLETDSSLVGKQICYDLWLLNDISLIVRYKPDGVFRGVADQIGVKQRVTMSPLVEYYYQFGGMTASEAQVFEEFVSATLKRSEVHMRVRVNPFVKDLMAVETLNTVRLQSEKCQAMYQYAVRKIHKLWESIMDQRLATGEYLLRIHNQEVEILSKCGPGCKGLFNLHEYCDEAKVSCSLRIQTPSLAELWSPIDPNVVLNWHKVKQWAPGCFPPRDDSATTAATRSNDERVKKTNSRRKRRAELAARGNNKKPWKKEKPK